MMACRLLAALTIAFVFSTTGMAQFPPVLPEHKILMQDVGEWDGVIKIWGNEQGVADESVKPTVSKATEVNKKFGEYWCTSTFKGSNAGIWFQWHTISGFDSVTKKFVATRVSTISPSSVEMVGTYDEKTKTITSEAKLVKPDGEGEVTKTTMLYKDKDTRVFTAYQTVDSKAVKMMEITYTRKK